MPINILYRLGTGVSFRLYQLEACFRLIAPWDFSLHLSNTIFVQRLQVE